MYIYIYRLLIGCKCDMVFIASGCLISRTRERSERVSDIKQPQAYVCIQAYVCVNEVTAVLPAHPLILNPQR